MVFLLFLLLAGGILLIVFVSDPYVFVRNKINNKDSLEKDATIIKIEPFECGSKGSRHFDVIISFSDGSTYQAKCGNETIKFGSIKYYSFDKSQVPGIVKLAQYEHDEAYNKMIKKREKRGK